MQSTNTRINSNERYERRVSYLQRLKRLTFDEGRSFLALFDEVVKAKQITPSVERLLATHCAVEPIASLAKELLALVAEIVSAGERQDEETFSQLQCCLDDINIAVNAWSNRICLHRSARLYVGYQQLRHQAKHMNLN